jgi:hypothetical protein
VLPRNEVEQLVGQELINTLRDFKQLTVAPSSPHSQQFTSSVEKSLVEHLGVAQNFNHHQKIKVKARKSIVKVVRDMLTKKWIFVKRDKKLSTLAEVARLLEALRLPP